MARDYEVDTAARRTPRQCILPPDILDKLARAGDEVVRNAALDALQWDRQFRLTRAEAAGRLGGRMSLPITFARIGGAPQRSVYDQSGATTQTPGKLVRGEGQKAVKDAAVNQAYDALGATYQFYWTMFQRDSIDGQGLPMLGLVHFGSNYANAFWDNVRHMFFGDGDGQILLQTTAGIDVVGHELTHGVTQHEANLTYSGQSGALNESISDVFGIMVKQWTLKQTVTQSDWLIGADIVGAALKPALRSMKAPGTANQHDAQPADMDRYVEGGDVHVNSGIPNHAFAVCATTLGGNAWDAAGRVWYSTLTDQRLTPGATFTEFARLTVANAQHAYGQGSKEALAVQAGWDAAKVPTT
jgi:Zn-dependent metalloprotease